MSIIKVAATILAAFITGAGCSYASERSPTLGFPQQAPERQPDVVFVPTPERVVSEMLRMANVQRNEMVYDLGCGDGRIVISAVRDFGARGVGVDIDPQRILESRENAEKAGVSDRVKFLQADLFTMDFRDADVIALYLLPRLNVQLRPRLLDELRPGTRIVSHAFDMGDWEADQQTVVTPGSYSVFYWVIPAKVEGSWQVTMPQGAGTLNLKQKYQKVQGTLTLEGRAIDLRDAQLEGRKLTFTFDDGSGAAQATAEIDGDHVTGKLQRRGQGEQQWMAQRANR